MYFFSFDGIEKEKENPEDKLADERPDLVLQFLSNLNRKTNEFLSSLFIYL
jgi:hypothetical protein